NTPRPVHLPDTDDFKPANLVRYPDQVPVPPADQHIPGQERGVRPARAIPYTLHADGHATERSFEIDFQNTGRAAAVFRVRSTDNPRGPRNCPAEPGRPWAAPGDPGSGYALPVHGPNGFYRRFTAGNPQTTPTSLDVTASYHERPSQIILEITNRGSE